MSEQEKNAPEGSPDPKAISFTTFILSLSTAALQHLGVGPVEGQEKVGPNLLLAQQTIDILAMLQAKTKNNLSESEDKLLGNILYDLRMRYVDAKRS